MNNVELIGVGLSRRQRTPAQLQQAATHAALLMVGASAPTDPAWATVVHLAHLDGANGSSTFTDSSTLNLPCGQNGGTDTISTTQSVFGGASLRHGTGASIANGGDNAYQFQSSDFTIEFRFRPDAVATVNIFDMRLSGQPSGTVPILYTLSNGALVYYVNGVDRITSATGVITATTWKAIAVSRVSGTTRMFVDGTQVGSNYTDGNNYNTSARICIGSYVSAQQNCYYDEVRLSNGRFGSGAGRYAANYTIATAAFPNS